MFDDQALASNWIVVGALASPHILYAFIWFFPHIWMRYFRKQSVEVFEGLAWTLKALQFSSVAYWFMLRRPEGVDLLAITPLQLLVGGALGLGGQTLNAGIFRAIGHPGVYYGFKLGHTIPWVEGFPFNVVRHPQYVGSVMSVWAGAVLLWSQAPAGLGLLTSYWTALYVITGWMESSLHV